MSNMDCTGVASDTGRKLGSNLINRDHFSLVAPFYDRTTGVLDADRLYELVAMPPGGRLLDAAGGTGRVSEALKDVAGQIVVTDLSAGMLRQAACKNGLSPVRAHAEALPFATGTFDRIVVVDAWHHLCDQREAAAELWRVLARGGRLVIEEPNIDSWPVKMVALGERLLLMRSRFYSLPDISAAFEALGGRVETYADHAFNAWVVVDK